MAEVEIGRELGRDRRRVDAELARLLRSEKGVPRRLKDAMRHSVMSGGKRLRPVLMLWTYDALRSRRKAAPREEVLIAACGLEMLHTYSLIHDDLPAMDDDVLRRGKPTCHVAFDEATAILAGDALQALGFELLARAGGPRAGQLVQQVARAVGPAGMVGGQQDDLDAEGRASIDGKLVKRIHLNKTARLLAAAMLGGAILAGAEPDPLASVQKAGLELGLAFQAADDVLDVTATSDQLGKTAGKDEAAQKATWVRVEGVEKAGRRCRRHGENGRRLLADTLPANPATARLLSLSELMWNRDR